MRPLSTETVALAYKQIGGLELALEEVEETMGQFDALVGLVASSAPRAEMQDRNAALLNERLDPRWRRRPSLPGGSQAEVPEDFPGLTPHLATYGWDVSWSEP